MRATNLPPTHSNASPHDRKSPFMRSIYQERGLPQLWSSPVNENARYIDIRIPANADTNSLNSSPSPHNWKTTHRRSTMSPFTPSFVSCRPVSPYGFQPISGDPQQDQRVMTPLQFSPTPMSPYGKISPSPSVMTEETSSLTFESNSRYSPATFRSNTPSSFRSVTPQSDQFIDSRGQRVTTPRPKTPNGRKSPFAKKEEDDAVRKTRIKTELCIHYANGRPCPFGASCTYAHGEEELQLTKLLDLHEAGLIDVGIFRTKPCLTWVATGSWYVQGPAN